MQTCLIESSFSPKQALTHYDGYSIIKDKVYVIMPALESFPKAKIITSSIISGIEYGSNHESLGLTMASVSFIISEILDINRINVQPIKGGYVYKDGTPIEEASILIDCKQLTDFEIAIASERLRVALRQESVLAVMSDGTVNFV